MPNYALKLKIVLFDTVRKKNQSTSSITWVIVADDLEMARRIGNTMIGEEVAHIEKIVGLAGVVETEDPPHVPSWNHESLWNRVLSRMDLKKKDVEFVYGKGGEKVGFKILRSPTS